MSCILRVIRQYFEVSEYASPSFKDCAFLARVNKPFTNVHFICIWSQFNCFWGKCDPFSSYKAPSSGTLFDLCRKLKEMFWLELDRILFLNFITTKRKSLLIFKNACSVLYRNIGVEVSRTQTVIGLKNICLYGRCCCVDSGLSQKQIDWFC